jgi:MFS family permease
VAATVLPSLRRNLPLFIAFRVLFNARFYYPVLGVLIMDLGLTLEQYALLNVIWAGTIILLEIPTGALADVIGRKRVVVLASMLMVAEMVVFAFAPRGDWMFWFLVLNRLLSGAAEACASAAPGARSVLASPTAATPRRTRVAQRAHTQRRAHTPSAHPHRRHRRRQSAGCSHPGIP